MVNDHDNLDSTHPTSEETPTRRERIETLTKELYYIAESIATCNGLLESIQSAKEQITRHCSAFLDEMSLSKKDWEVNLMEIGTVEHDVQSVIDRCLEMQGKAQRELAKLNERKDDGKFDGNASSVKR